MYNWNTQYTLNTRLHLDSRALLKHLNDKDIQTSTNSTKYLVNNFTKVTLNPPLLTLNTFLVNSQTKQTRQNKHEGVYRGYLSSDSHVVKSSTFQTRFRGVSNKEKSVTCYPAKEQTRRSIEYNAFEEGPYISTNQKRENSPLLLLIG